MEAALVAQAHVRMHVLISALGLAEETAAAVPERVQAVLRNVEEAANTHAILLVQTPVVTHA